MTVAIYSRGADPDQHNDIQLLLDALHQYQIETIVFEPLFQQVQHWLNWHGPVTTFSQSEHLDPEVLDCVISLGGDGTLLDTATLVRDKNIPILGINFGRLGFLASMGRDEVAAAVEALAEGSYELENRTLIHLDASEPLFGDTPFALNEFAILKGEVSAMIKIHTYLNGEFLNTYWADGIIVSTPTGSTGYNLSCSGPIVFPDCGTFVITPVAPHNLNVRPIVVPDHHILSFEVESRSGVFICTLDARREIVTNKIELAVRKENFNIRLIRLYEKNFLQNVRTKLSWGLDKRN